MASEEEKTVVIPKSAADVQRMKLEKLMKNPVSIMVSQMYCGEQVWLLIGAYIVNILLSLKGHSPRSTWSETYFRQDLFSAYLFFRRQFHAIVVFRLKLIPDLDSGS